MSRERDHRHKDEGSHAAVPAADAVTRLQVLGHIEMHETAETGCRVPDAWIDEANAAIEDGESVRGADGRRLTEAGRRVLTDARPQL